MHSLLQVSQHRYFGEQSLVKTGIVSAILVTFLSSCASTQTYEPATIEAREVLTAEEPYDPSSEDVAQAYDTEPTLSATEIDENEQAAARAEYFRDEAAQQSSSFSKVESSLNAAEYYVQAGQAESAVLLVYDVQELPFTESQQQRATVVLAYGDYAAGRFDTALARLEPLLANAYQYEEVEEQDKFVPIDASELLRPPGEEELDNREYLDQSDTIPIQKELSTSEIDALLLASFCNQQTGNFEQAISTLVRRESALVGAARAETTRYIWQIVSSLPTYQREQIAATSQDPKVVNRVSLGLSNETSPVIDEPQEFTQWRDEIATEQAQWVDESWDINSPQSVYVLLPFSSRFEKAANAVRDGIQKQHAENTSPYRPRLHFYDIGDNPLQIGQYYAAAVRAGADFIIGPLGKSYSNEANESRSLFVNNSYAPPVPMLMLGGDTSLTANTMRLSMNPEQEGRNAADRAWQEGHLSAAVIADNSTRSQRVLQGFNQRWSQLGGNLAKSIQYSKQQFDHSVELKQLFDINLSEGRHLALSQTLGFKPKFSAYQRADIDFVFMISDADSGKIVRPQINFFASSTLPVYSTSALYNGIEDKINNMDLDNTMFPVMPWVVRSGSSAQYAGQLNMLFALGMDSYKIAGNYKTLEEAPKTSLKGNTGSISLDNSGEFVFMPVWAKFEEGSLSIVEDAGIDLTPLSEDTTPEGGDNDSELDRRNYSDDNWDQRNSSRKAGG